MRTQLKLAVGLLSVGLMAAPVMTSSARAADEAPKTEAPKEAPREGAAREGRGGGQRGGPGAQVDRLKATVIEVAKPTDEQKAKLEPIFAAAKTKVEAAAKEAGDDRAAAREKTRPIIEQLRTDVNAVLTDEQKANLEKARQERGGNRGQGGQGRRPGGAGGGEQPKQ